MTPAADATPRGCIELVNRWYATSLTFGQVRDIEKRAAEVLWPLAVIIPALLVLFASASVCALGYLFAEDPPPWSLDASLVSLGVAVLFGILWGALEVRAKKAVRKFLTTSQDRICPLGDYGIYNWGQFEGLADSAKRLHQAKCKLESAGDWSGISPEAGNAELIRLTQAVSALDNHRPANQNGRKASGLKRGSLTPEMKVLADGYKTWKTERDRLENSLAKRHNEFNNALIVVKLAADMAT